MDKKTTRKTSKKSRPRRKRSGGSLLGAMGAVLIGAVLMLAAYIAVSYFFFVTPLSFRWKAMYGEPDYPTGYDVMGIDISHHQGNIEWEHLRNAKVNGKPLRFVFVKATEGTTLLDENFNENF